MESLGAAQHAPVISLIGGRFLRSQDKLGSDCGYSSSKRVRARRKLSPGPPTPPPTPNPEAMRERLGQALKLPAKNVRFVEPSCSPKGSMAGNSGSELEGEIKRNLAGLGYEC